MRVEMMGSCVRREATSQKEMGDEMKEGAREAAELPRFN